MNKVIDEKKLLKMASEDPKLKESLLLIAKYAADETQFNESVPATGPDQAPNGEPQAGDGTEPTQPVIDPMQQQMAPQASPASDPASAGAAAAQAFLAPVFEAAAQGDPNAQMTLAKASGEIARGVIETMKSGGEMVDGSAPVVTPEEQVADQILPAQASPAPMTGEPAPAPIAPEAAGQGGAQVVAVPAEAQVVSGPPSAAPAAPAEEKKPFPPKKKDEKDDKNKDK